MYPQKWITQSSIAPHNLAQRSRSQGLSHHTSISPGPAAAERAVADLLPIEAEPGRANEVLRSVPFWFHTFALNKSHNLYTPGVARDHRYRIPPFPRTLGGRSVLDVGTFDGFYAFLAESRGARRVVAVDNEQYRRWVRSRYRVELKGGEGFRAVRDLIKSQVEYVTLDAYKLEALGGCFDVIICFGILHRVREPTRLLRVLRQHCEAGGAVIVETHGAMSINGPPVEVQAFKPNQVYPGDSFVYWGFTSRGLTRLASAAGFQAVEILDTPMIHGHPRLVARLYN